LLQPGSGLLWGTRLAAKLCVRRGKPDGA